MGEADPQVRRRTLQALIDAEAAGLEKLCMDLIEDKELNLLAARGLAKFEGPEIGQRLAIGYAGFREEDRKVIEIPVQPLRMG